VKLTFIGHACFLAESSTGLRIVIDPYRPYAFNGRFGLRPFAEPVDIVVSTHDHHDHFHVDPAFGNPDIVREPGTARGITFSGIRLPHDAAEGAERGWVTGFRFELDGIAIFHPGDLGRPLTDDEIARVGPVDVLLVPCGGTFTIGPDEAAATIARVRPAIAIPMHYAWPTIDLPLRPVADFLACVPSHRIVDRQPMVLSCETMPQPTGIWVPSPTH
jgi:L-ascorbate metabolism protein UlaG (beta-lactamase superfamily)